LNAKQRRRDDASFVTPLCTRASTPPAMTQRDWEKELAKIDKQLASMPDDALLPPAQPTGTGMPRGVTGSALRSAGTAVSSAPGASRKATIWTYTKLAVAIAAGVGVWFWPWPARCGMPLMGLVAAGGGVGLLGIWSAFGTWRHRLGRAHIVSLLVLVSGVALVAREVLPRVGYAEATFDRPARWTCQAEPPAPAVTPTPGAATRRQGAGA